MIETRGWHEFGYTEGTHGKPVEKPTCEFTHSYKSLAPKILYRWRHQFMSQKTCKPVSTCKKFTILGNFPPYFSIQHFNRYLWASPITDGGRACHKCTYRPTWIWICGFFQFPEADLDLIRAWHGFRYPKGTWGKPAKIPADTFEKITLFGNFHPYGCHQPFCRYLWVSPITDRGDNLGEKSANRYHLWKPHRSLMPCLRSDLDLQIQVLQIQVPHWRHAKNFWDTKVTEYVETMPYFAINFWGKKLTKISLFKTIFWNKKWEFFFLPNGFLTQGIGKTIQLFFCCCDHMSEENTAFEMIFDPENFKKAEIWKCFLI